MDQEDELSTKALRQAARDLQFETPVLGDVVTIRYKGETFLEVDGGILVKTMQEFLARDWSVPTNDGDSINVYRSAREEWNSSDCRIEFDGFTAVKLDREGASRLARVLLAFSVAGAPCTSPTTKHNWVLRVERVAD
jgi:hypothetical protein